MNPEVKGAIIVSVVAAVLGLIAFITVTTILSLNESRKYSYRMEAYTFCVQTAKIGKVENAEVQCLNKF